MPRFENFIVDPWKGANQAQEANFRRNQLEQRQRESEQSMTQRQAEMQQRNQLEQQRMNLYGRAEDRRFQQGERSNTIAQGHLDTRQQEMQSRVAKQQMTTAYKLMKNAKDENSYQMARAGLMQMSEAGLYPQESPFISQMPEHYDPAKVNQFLAIAESFMDVQKEKADKPPTSYQEHLLEQQDPEYAARQERIRGGAEKDEEEEIDPREIATVRARITDLYKMLINKRDRGGYGWKPGQEMPSEILEQINGLREAIGEKPLTAREARTKRWWGPDKVETRYVPSDEEQAKQLTREKAVEYMRKAGGDRKKAEQLAKEDGYQF